MISPRGRAGTRQPDFWALGLRKISKPVGALGVWNPLRVISECRDDVLTWRIATMSS